MLIACPGDTKRNDYRVQTYHTIYIDHRSTPIIAQRQLNKVQLNESLVEVFISQGIDWDFILNKTVDYLEIQLENRVHVSQSQHERDLIHNSWIIRLKTDCMIRSVSLDKVHEGLGCVFTRCEILLKQF